MLYLIITKSMSGLTVELLVIWDAMVFIVMQSALSQSLILSKDVELSCRTVYAGLANVIFVATSMITGSHSFSGSAAFYKQATEIATSIYHDEVIKCKHFPRYCPFVRGIHRSLVNSPHKGQWRRALMFSLICVWINGWVNNREAGDLRRHRAHCDVIVMNWM